MKGNGISSGKTITSFLEGQWAQWEKFVENFASAQSGWQVNNPVSGSAVPGSGSGSQAEFEVQSRECCMARYRHCSTPHSPSFISAEVPLGTSSRVLATHGMREASKPRNQVGTNPLVVKMASWH